MIKGNLSNHHNHTQSIGPTMPSWVTNQLAVKKLRDSASNSRQQTRESIRKQVLANHLSNVSSGGQAKTGLLQNYNTNNPYDQTSNGNQNFKELAQAASSQQNSASSINTVVLQPIMTEHMPKFINVTRKNQMLVHSFEFQKGVGCKQVSVPSGNLKEFNSTFLQRRNSPTAIKTDGKTGGGGGSGHQRASSINSNAVETLRGSPIQKGSILQEKISILEGEQDNQRHFPPTHTQKQSLSMMNHNSSTVSGVMEIKEEISKIQGQSKISNVSADTTNKSIIIKNQKLFSSAINQYSSNISIALPKQQMLSPEKPQKYYRPPISKSALGQYKPQQNKYQKIPIDSQMAPAALANIKVKSLVSELNEIHNKALKNKKIIKYNIHHLRQANPKTPMPLYGQPRKALQTSDGCRGGANVVEQDNNTPIYGNPSSITPKNISNIQPSQINIETHRRQVSSVPSKKNALSNIPICRGKRNDDPFFIKEDLLTKSFQEPSNNKIVPNFIPVPLDMQQIVGIGQVQIPSGAPRTSAFSPRSESTDQEPNGPPRENQYVVFLEDDSDIASCRTFRLNISDYINKYKMRKQKGRHLTKEFHKMQDEFYKRAHKEILQICSQKIGQHEKDYKAMFTHQGGFIENIAYIDPEIQIVIVKESRDDIFVGVRNSNKKVFSQKDEKSEQVRSNLKNASDRWFNGNIVDWQTNNENRIQKKNLNEGEEMYKEGNFILDNTKYWQKKTSKFIHQQSPSYYISKEKRDLIEKSTPLHRAESPDSFFRTSVRNSIYQDKSNANSIQQSQIDSRAPSPETNSRVVRKMSFARKPSPLNSQSGFKAVPMAEKKSPSHYTAYQYANNISYEEAKEIGAKYKIKCKRVYDLHSLFIGFKEMAQSQNLNDTKQSFHKRKSNTAQHNSNPQVPLNILQEYSILIKDKHPDIIERSLRALNINVNSQDVKVSWQQFIQLNALMEFQTVQKQEYLDYWIKILDPLNLGKLSEQEYFDVINKLAQGAFTKERTLVSKIFAKNLKLAFNKLDCLDEKGQLLIQSFKEKVLLGEIELEVFNQLFRKDCEYKVKINGEEIQDDQDMDDIFYLK